MSIPGALYYTSQAADGKWADYKLVDSTIQRQSFDQISSVCINGELHLVGLSSNRIYHTKLSSAGVWSPLENLTTILKDGRSFSSVSCHKRFVINGKQSSYDELNIVAIQLGGEKPGAFIQTSLSRSRQWQPYQDQTNASDALKINNISAYGGETGWMDVVGIRQGNVWHAKYGCRPGVDSTPTWFKKFTQVPGNPPPAPGGGSNSFISIAVGNDGSNIHVVAVDIRTLQLSYQRGFTLPDGEEKWLPNFVPVGNVAPGNSPVRSGSFF